MEFLPWSIRDAARHGDLETVEIWLDENPDSIDLHSKVGDTLLACAIHASRDLVFRYLIAKGADVDHECEGVMVAALHMAAGHLVGINRVRLLLDAGASVDIRDGRLQTPLHLAARGSTLAKTRLLVSRGAALDLLDENGRSPEEFARLMGSTENADFLAAVRAAGGWREYLREPRINLLMLRLLCQDGRATAPAGTVLERLFAPPPPEPARRSSRSAARKRRGARTTLPKEVFWHVASFWRSDRDD
jgi:hypothetical protein